MEQFEKTLKTKRNISKEHGDYILIKELYHCSPKDLDECDENILNLHYSMLMKEREREFIEMKRQEQKSKNSTLNK